MKEDGKYVYKWKKMNDRNTAHLEQQYLLWIDSARDPRLREFTILPDLYFDPRAEDYDPEKYQGNAHEFNWKIIFDTEPTNHLLQNKADYTNKIKIMRTERRGTDVPTPPMEVDGLENAQYNLVPQASDGVPQAHIFPHLPYVHSHPSPPHLSGYTQRTRSMCRGGVPPTPLPPVADVFQVADVFPPADGFPPARIRPPVRLQFK